MSDGIVRYAAADGAQVEMPAAEIVSLLANGQRVSEQDARSIVARCQARGLNPFAGDAYVIVRGGHATVQVSKDYYLRVAAAQPTFDGMEAGVVVAKADGSLEHRQGSLVSANPKVEKLVGGWARVFDRNRSHPSYAEVSLHEYDQHQSLWASKPATMVRKVALVQALRECYPNKFSQLYDEAEMPAEAAAVDEQRGN